jgi:hypothetical protein
LRTSAPAVALARGGELRSACDVELSMLPVLCVLMRVSLPAIDRQQICS